MSRSMGKDKGERGTENKKYALIRYLVQIGIALVMSLLFMELRHAFDSGITTEERIRGVGDGISITALLYISFGILLWVSSTGFFDIFGYAFRKGAHALIPGMGLDKHVSYYDYKEERAAKRKTKPIRSTLLIGLGLFVISMVLVVVWYQT